MGIPCPFFARCPSQSMGCGGCSHRCPWLIRRRPAGRAVETLPRGHGARAGRRRRAVRAPPRAAARRSTRASAGRAWTCGCRGVRCGCSASGRLRSCPRCPWRADASDKSALAPFAGCAAHSVLPLERRLTAAPGLVFWPHRARRGVAGRGGRTGGDHPRAGEPTVSFGGQVQTGRWVRSLADLPPARAYLFDTSPGRAREHRGARAARRLRPQAEALSLRTWCVHDRLGPRRSDPVEGTPPSSKRRPFTSGARSTRSPRRRAPSGAGRCPSAHSLPIQQSQFDPSRAPDGKHTGYSSSRPRRLHAGPDGGRRASGRAGIRPGVSRPRGSQGTS